jgi:heme exporter protein B
MTALHPLRAFVWLVLKDLRCELRGRRVWPAMLLLGLVLVLLLEMQLDLPAEDKHQVVSGLLWLDVFFAGTLALERSFAGEREEGCWQALLLYPVPRCIHYLAKMAVIVLALGVLEGLLIVAFSLFSGTPFLDHLAPLAVIALLGNLGFSAVGVLVSALTAGCSGRGGLLALLVFPLVTPVLVGAAEATRLLVAGRVDDSWWSWVQLLSAFVVLFTTIGILVFAWLLED